MATSPNPDQAYEKDDEELDRDEKPAIAERSCDRFEAMEACGNEGVSAPWKPQVDVVVDRVDDGIGLWLVNVPAGTRASRDDRFGVLPRHETRPFSQMGTQARQ